MGKYDKYKKLVLAANLIKSTVTTSLPGGNGKLTTAGPGNEGVEMVEWINERIDDGSIVTIPPIAATNLSMIRDNVSVTVESDTGTDAIIPAATTLLAGIMTANDKLSINSLVTLTGVPSNSLNLGTFSGSIIPDNVTIKIALQSLETVVGSIPAITVGDLTSSSTALTVTGGTASVINSGVSLTVNPGNILLSTLGGSLDLNQLSITGAISGQFLVFDGTNYVPTTYNPPIQDHNSLTGLQGGIATEYYHLDQEVYDAIYNLSGGELLGKASYIGAPQIQAITLGGSTIMNLTTGVISLVNDSATPGNSKYYGTDGTGIKGWYSSLTSGTVTNVSATNSVDLTFTVTNPTTTPDITAVLTNTTVTPGTYGSSSAVGQFVVNNKGRLTGAGVIPIVITSSNVTDFNESVDDRVNGLLVAGTNISLVYNDVANTLTINSTGGGITGTGVANRVAYWTSVTNLGNDADFTFDGTNVTIGSPVATSARLTTRGTGGTTATYGIIHQNSTNIDVFKVTDKGSLLIGALNEIDLHPDYINISTGGTYPISVAGGDFSLYSDTTVLVEGGGSASNTPSFKSLATRSTNIGVCVNAQIEGTFAMNAGSNSYYDLYVNTNVNQTGGTSPIKSIYVNPVLTAATNYTGIEINTPGHTALRTTAGNVRFDFGSDAEGDLFYRNAAGNLVRLPVGGPMEVLGSTGTVPAWTTTAGSLPGGSNGDVLMYVSGSWAAASPTVEKQTGITGTNVTLGATPLGSTLFQLFRNGIYQDETDDYTRVGTTLTMSVALVSSDKITIIYYT